MEIWNEFIFNGPLDTDLIQKVNGVGLPADYLDFMKAHNGGEGDTGNVWVQLFQMDELAERNEEYEVAEYLPDCCIIGSNGGGELFGVDADGNYFTVPDMIDEDDVVRLGTTLEEFIQKLNEYFEPEEE